MDKLCENTFEKSFNLNYEKGIIIGKLSVLIDFYVEGKIDLKTCSELSGLSENLFLEKASNYKAFSRKKKHKKRI